MNLWLMLAGGLICLIWGAAHIFPTRPVVTGFGELTTDNRRIIIMEWIAEGMTLMFIGLVVILVYCDVATVEVARRVVRACAGMLVALAILSTATGARTSVLPMRLCPVVKTIAAGLLIAGSWS